MGRGGRDDAADRLPAGTARAHRPCLAHGTRGLAAELTVVDQADPVLFFGDDGRRLSATVSLPQSQVWIMHPADRDLEFTGQPGQIVEPAVPFGWDGWKLRGVSLEDVQAVGLRGGRPIRWRPWRGRGCCSANRCPVSRRPSGRPCIRRRRGSGPAGRRRGHQVVRRDQTVGAGAPLVGRAVDPDDQVDIWQGVPRPVLGAFEITVRGPLGRGLRRTVFVAEA